MGGLSDEEREEGKQDEQGDGERQDTEMSRPEPEGEQAEAPKVAKDPGQTSAQEIADGARTVCAGRAQLSAPHGSSRREGDPGVGGGLLHASCAGTAATSSPRCS